jgi:hypothetical protein
MLLKMQTAPVRGAVAEIVRDVSDAAAAGTAEIGDQTSARSS